MNRNELQITIAFRLPAPLYMELAEKAEVESKGNLSEVARRVVAVGLETLRTREGVQREPQPA